MTATIQPPVARLELVTRADAHEGPVYVPDEDALYVTSVRTDRVALRRVDLASGAVSTLLHDANMANGMALAPDGRLLVCEQGTLASAARISAVDRATGEATTVVDAYDGRPLNSPNDVAVADDGAIWFTDPSYGRLQGFRPEPQLGDAVYRVDPRLGAVELVTRALDKPNGLAFSPDGRTLYVCDSGAIHAPGDYDASRPRRVHAFDVTDGRVGRGRVFADEVPGFPDGIETDADGRVYVSSADGVLVYAQGGTALGLIELPGAVNFTFSRPGVLLITADDAVWAAHLT